MAKKAYIGVDCVARKIKKGYIGVLDKMVRFDGDMYYDADGEYWVSDSIAHVEKKAKFSTAHVEFDGVLYKDLYVETYISHTGNTFKTVYIPNTDIYIEFSSTGDCGLHDSGEELDTGRTYSLKIYTGNLESVARKIKKAYIGIGGVARPCWSGGELAYYGAITSLSAKRYEFAATSNDNYAIFLGGSGSPTAVDAYNKSLSRTVPAALSTGKFQHAATTVGGYALFGFGQTGANLSRDVYAYDSSLTRKDAETGLDDRYELAATTVGNHALFGGGMGYSLKNTVDAYGTSLTRSNPSGFGTARQMLAATTVGSYALFGGGSDSSGYGSTVVDAYNSSLTRSAPSALRTQTRQLAATSVGDYALFGGGQDGNGNFHNTVTSYTPSLTRSTATNLTGGKYWLSATTVGNYAIFGGGYKSGSFYDTVDVYDASLTKTTFTVTRMKKYAMAATSIGDYAIFGGGFNTSFKSDNTVDAFVVA